MAVAAWALGRGGFVGAGVAFGVFPGHGNFVARFGAFDGELQEGVFGDR